MCGRMPSQAAHIRFTNPEYPQKRAVGIGEKPSDRWCINLCVGCHLDDPDSQHKVGEEAFWARVGVDPFRVADELWREFCAAKGADPDEDDAVVVDSRKMKRRREIAAARPKPPKRKANFSRPSGIKRKWPKRPFPTRRRDA